MAGREDSDDDEQIIDTQRMAFGGTLSANGGRDWSCLSVVQNDYWGYRASGHVKPVHVGCGNHPFAVASGTGKHADKGRID